MGYGDSLMARGDAWALHNATGKQVAIGNGQTVDTSDRVLDYGMDFLATQHQVDQGGVEWVHSYGGNRPYIDYEALRAYVLEKRGVSMVKTRKLVGLAGRYLYNLDYRPIPAPIVLTPEEEDLVGRLKARGPFAVVEPFIKTRAPPGKQWPVDRFAEVARRLSADLPVYQISAPERPVLEGLVKLPTNSFRSAMTYIAASSLYVGPEGGLHHAAAAVKTRAVVIYGGFTSPLITGYPPLHVNLTGDNDGYACGTRYAVCPHCTRALDSVAPTEVLEHAHRLLEQAHA